MAWIDKNIAGWPTLNSLTQSHLSPRNSRIDLIHEPFEAFLPDVAAQWCCSRKRAYARREGSLSQQDREEKKEQADGGSGSKQQGRTNGEKRIPRGANM